MVSSSALWKADSSDGMRRAAALPQIFTCRKFILPVRNNYSNNFKVLPIWEIVFFKISFLHSITKILNPIWLQGQQFLKQAYQAVVNEVLFAYFSSIGRPAELKLQIGVVIALALDIWSIRGLFISRFENRSLIFSLFIRVLPAALNIIMFIPYPQISNVSIFERW